MHAYLQTARGWFSQSGFRRDAAVLFTSTALARVLLVLTMPLVARQFVPGDVGHWQLFVSLGTVIGAIVCLRYEVAIPLPQDEPKARQLAAAAMFVALAGTLLLSLVIVIGRDAFVRWIASPELTPYLWYLPLMALLIGAEQIATYWLTRTGDFTSQGVSRLLKSAFSVALPLAMAVALGAKLSYLIIGTLVGQAAATVYIARRDVWRAFKQSIDGAQRPSMFAAMREYKNYPLYVAPYAFIGQFAKRLVLLLLATYAGASAVGCFAMAMQITFVPITFVTGSLSQAFYRRASMHADLRELEKLVLKVLGLQIIGAVPAFTLLIVHSEYLMRLVLGPGWGETAAYVAWLAPASLSVFLTSWLDRMLDKLGQQRSAVIMQLSFDALSLGMLFLGLRVWHSTLLGIAAYCCMTVVYSTGWLLVAFSKAGYSFKALGKLAVLGTLLAGAVVAVHLLLGGALRQPFGLITETLCAAMLALVTLRLTRKHLA